MLLSLPVSYTHLDVYKRQLDMLISEETGLAVHVAEDAISCVAKGTGMALDMLHVLQRQGGRP